jgi:hypothetical protein
MAIVYTPIVQGSTDSTSSSSNGIKKVYGIEDGRNVTGNNITAPSAFNTDAVLATAVDGYSKSHSPMIEDNLDPYIITDASNLITKWYEAWNNYYSKVQDAITNNDTDFLEKYVFYVSNVATDTTTTPATSTSP